MAAGDDNRGCHHCVSAATTLFPDAHKSVLKSSGTPKGIRFYEGRGQSPKMPQCSATCKDGNTCRHKSKPGLSVCGKHIRQGKTVFVILCGKRMNDGTKCKCPRGVGMRLCKRHHNAEVKKARKKVLDDLFDEAMFVLWEGIMPHGEWLVYVTDRLTAIDATPQEHTRWGNYAVTELEFYLALHPQVGVGLNPPKTDLEALSRDNQNVHTGAVNKQTASGVTTLLETPLVVGQDTLAEIKEVWETRPVATRKSILKDMTRWYQTALCRTEDDYLYRRLLDGLWTRIKLSPHKEDLVQRLWEEADESRKMCCEGHISRLCNVLVGYDETFQAPVSAGEMLQQKIAAISAEDISIPHKVIKAWDVMEELQIPREQRMEWIGAF